MKTLFLAIILMVGGCVTLQDLENNVALCKEDDTASCHEEIALWDDRKAEIEARALETIARAKEVLQKSANQK